MGAFSDSIKQAQVNILEKINQKIYEIAWFTFTSTVNFSPSPSNPGPEADGLLANQWYPSEGSPSAELTTAQSNNGADSLARINQMRKSKGTTFLGKDGAVFLTNNVDYAYLAEVEGWNPPRWRGTVPYRMVAKSLQLAAEKYKKVRL